MSEDSVTLLRVVLLGKTGAGKSSLGNTLLGRNAFRVSRGMMSATRTCELHETTRQGVTLQVTDTPGLCDTHRDEKETLMEVGRSVAMTAPGPHVVLLVLRCDRRFTDEEYGAYVMLKEFFSPDICSYMIIVFAGIDAFGSTVDTQRQCFQEELKSCTTRLREILQDAGRRCFGVNNIAQEADREKQANDLLALMKDVSKQNKFTYFSGGLCADVNILIEGVLEQKMRTNNITRSEAERETKEEITTDVLREWLGQVFDLVYKFFSKIKLGLQRRNTMSPQCAVM